GGTAATRRASRRKADGRGPGIARCRLAAECAARPSRNQDASESPVKKARSLGRAFCFSWVFNLPKFGEFTTTNPGSRS
ncbi:hypothetical protein, partial [Burkholderia thailandensis]|uniref:hypothetical protein n=1 Tax=Burkholderia thailandensis TaxID=57975 RepID=UPI0021CA097C